MVKKRNKYSSVEEVPVWIHAHELTILVYEITQDFPKDELCGITSQIRRSVSSIPANMSEGFYRKSLKELLQFLFISRGSLGETRYFIRLARDLEYISEKEKDKLFEKVDNIGKQLNGWINSLKRINNK